MTGRLWYLQLDVYDAIGRIAGLLVFWDVASPPSRERLYIADFCLANPPLLHKTHMSRQIRNKFNALGITRPERAFISYPSPPLLFQKMEEVQRQAIRTLTGKGLIDLPTLERGVVTPSQAGCPLFLKRGSCRSLAMLSGGWRGSSPIPLPLVSRKLQPCGVARGSGE